NCPDIGIGPQEHQVLREGPSTPYACSPLYKGRRPPAKVTRVALYGSACSSLGLQESLPSHYDDYKT
ncbi:hypothetical protein GN958_ATG03491, partial [Phytophthora infestans]